MHASEDPSRRRCDAQDDTLGSPRFKLTHYTWARLAFLGRAVKYTSGDSMDELSLKDRITSLEERLTAFGRHL